MFRLLPGLALSWTMIADDVAFTFERIPTVVNNPGFYSTCLYPIGNIEVVDPFTSRLHIKRSNPLLPVNR